MSSTEKKPTILVTEGENRSSLAVTRSLGRYGCRVIVTGEREKNLSSCSRYCTGRYKVPSPISNGDGYLSAMREILSTRKVDVLFPMTEPSTLLLAQQRERLPGSTILACPSLEKIRAVFDKSTVFRLAEEKGVAIPWTLFVENREDFFLKKNEIQAFPVVVKPSQSRIPVKGGFVATSVRYVDDMAALEELYRTDTVLDFSSMIQEKITGPGTGLFTLFAGDHNLALFSHQRLLEKPPSGGVSVVCESVPLDREMVEASRRLLAAVGWQGVAMIEFKRDQRDGRAKLMEINGRFWGSLQLAIACGIDFPALYFDYLRGNSQTSLLPQVDYIIGHKLKWFFGILDHLIIRLKSSNTSLHLCQNSPNIWHVAHLLLKFWAGDNTYDVFDRTDIGPSMNEIALYFKNIL